ncbi:MAG: hypothetical protein IJ479_07300 [Alphaproteobacteria bacterium]|nr:hypothetical protein [Alphaproteobacteria bacterium]
MALSRFNHVKITGFKTVIPERCVNIDDELEFFDNNPKKLARAKKMIGYGNRYVSDKNTTVLDMGVDAARKLLTEMELNLQDIDLLIFINQKPDYVIPCDACIAHGLLGLPKGCATLNLNLGCSGYVHGLWQAFSLLESGNLKKCLILAGDIPARDLDPRDRKKAPIFGDAASATIVEYSEEKSPSTFVLGTDGCGWDKIVYPFGGRRIPLDKELLDLEVDMESGGKWWGTQGILKGEDVFCFTMDVAPGLIRQTMAEAGWTPDEVELFAIHQANKQIVGNIVDTAGIPAEKAPTEVFSKYANNSTTSVVTVLCDQPSGKEFGKTILCAYGVGLSWGGAALDMSGAYNGGISTYVTPKDKPGRQELIDYWINYAKGE